MNGDRTGPLSLNGHTVSHDDWWSADSRRETTKEEEMKSSQRPPEEKTRAGAGRLLARPKMEPQFIVKEVNRLNEDVSLKAFIRSLIHWAKEDGVPSEAPLPERNER